MGLSLGYMVPGFKSTGYTVSEVEGYGVHSLSLLLSLVTAHSPPDKTACSACSQLLVDQKLTHMFTGISAVTIHRSVNDHVNTPALTQKYN